MPLILISNNDALHLQSYCFISLIKELKFESRVCYVFKGRVSYIYYMVQNSINMSEELRRGLKQGIIFLTWLREIEKFSQAT